MIVASRPFGLLYLPRSLSSHERRLCKRLIHDSPHNSLSNCAVVSYLCHAGLANRLRAHIAATAFAIRHGLKIHAHWPRTDHFFGSFLDLFSPLPEAPIGNKKIFFLGREEPLEVPDRASLVILRLDWQYVELPELTALTLGIKDAIWKHLKPLPMIEDEVEKFSSHFPGPALGVHVRLGDFKRHNQAVPINRFISAIRSHDERSHSQLPIMLASDGSHSELAPLYDAFPNRIFRRRGSSERIGQDTIQDALVDLLLLSRCEYLILTPRSSFGQIASLLGDCGFENA